MCTRAKIGGAGRIMTWATATAQGPCRSMLRPQVFGASSSSKWPSALNQRAHVPCLLPKACSRRTGCPGMLPNAAILWAADNFATAPRQEKPPIKRVQIQGHAPSPFFPLFYATKNLHETKAVQLLHSGRQRAQPVKPQPTLLPMPYPGPPGQRNERDRYSIATGRHGTVHAKKKKAPGLRHPS